MFRKFFIFAMFATAAGYCFAEQNIPQATTAEVFGSTETTVTETSFADDYENNRYANVPAWPLAGSDADVTVKCADGEKKQNTNNIRIVSKIGDDMIVENGFEFSGTGWTGGANMLHGNRIPMGFDDECENGAEMPLLRRETLEDDGGNVLAVSRSGRKHCNKRSRNFKDMNNMYGSVTESETIDSSMVAYNDEKAATEMAVSQGENDAEAPKAQPDQVRSWVVASGQTLREVLQDWCDKEGWDLVWATSREYPIEASAVFKGRFTDVASALVRNFGRATPVPYAKFYKGNLVLVISTNEE